MHKIACSGFAVLVLAAAGCGGPADAVAPTPVLAARSSQSQGLLPDMRTVVPKHLGIQNAQQREILRFSNGIANTGAGEWRMRPEFPLGTTHETQDAIQEIRDADGNIVDEKTVSQFQFHEQHNHWHIDAVALFEVRKESPTKGSVVGGNSIKTTFCLIDWYKLDDNSPTTDRVFFECSGAFQGISQGWVDQYHQATEGQQLDITGVPVGDYFLVSTANPDGNFIEADLKNNSAWVKFRLSRDSEGNAKIEVLDHSPCDSPGLCGEQSTNR